MRELKRLTPSLMLAGLGIVALLFAFRGGVGPSREVWASESELRADATVIAQTGDYTVHLPLVMRWYDPSYVPPFGIVMYGSVTDTTGLQAMEDAGSQWVSTMLHWSAIEPTQGSYDWSSFDAKAQNAQEAGMDVFVLFTSNPSWAAALPGGPVTDTRDLVDFVTLAAERYDCDGMDDAPGSPCVHTWSFYAEPDNGDPGRAQYGKGYWGHNGAGYAEMLSQVSPAIHGANPRAQVLIGGLAYDGFEEEDGGPFVRSFLTDTLSALNTYPGGATAYIDAVAFHFYPIRAHRWPTIREKTMEIQGIMERHGVGDLPLICPEMGYWSSEKWGSSEGGQADRLVQMYVRALSVDMQPLSWYKVFDDAEAGSAQDEYRSDTAGLLDVYGNPKQSYYAYQTMTQELTGAYYLGELDDSDAEGYIFRMPDGYDKTVLWGIDSATSVPFPYSCLRVVDTDGTVYESVNDGDPTFDWDGQVNGQIALGVYENSPFYVEPCH